MSKMRESSEALLSNDVSVSPGLAHESASSGGPSEVPGEAPPAYIDVVETAIDSDVVVVVEATIDDDVVSSAAAAAGDRV